MLSRFCSPCSRENLLEGEPPPVYDHMLDPWHGHEADASRFVRRLLFI